MVAMALRLQEISPLCDEEACFQSSRNLPILKVAKVQTDCQSLAALSLAMGLASPNLTDYGV